MVRMRSLPRKAHPEGMTDKAKVNLPMTDLIVRKEAFFVKERMATSLHLYCRRLVCPEEGRLPSLWSRAVYPGK